MGGMDGYVREAQEARRAADEAEIAELSTLLDEVRAFARRVPVETRRQLAYQLRKAKQRDRHLVTAPGTKRFCTSFMNTRGLGPRRPER